MEWIPTLFGIGIAPTRDYYQTTSPTVPLSTQQRLQYQPVPCLQYNRYSTIGTVFYLSHPSWWILWISSLVSCLLSLLSSLVPCLLSSFVFSHLLSLLSSLLSSLVPTGAFLSRATLCSKKGHPSRNFFEESSRCVPWSPTTLGYDRYSTIGTWYSTIGTVHYR